MNRPLKINGKNYCENIVLEWEDWRDNYPSWVATEMAKELYRLLPPSERIRQRAIWRARWKDIVPSRAFEPLSW